MNPLLEKAEKFRSASRFKDAERTYRNLLSQPIDAAEKAEGLQGLADVERIQGSFPQAMKHYQAAGVLFKKIEPALVVDTQVGWALAARAMGKPRPALQELKRALAHYKKKKDQQGEAFVHWALGGTLRIAGNMREGLKELKKAQRLYVNLRDREGKAYVCCALGGIYRMLGRYEDSGRFYREANRRMRNLGDTFGTAYSYCGLGNVERMAGRFKAALPFYRKAEKLYGRIGDRVSYAYTLWSLGTTFKMMGRYPEAVRAFKKAHNLFKKTRDSRGQIYTLLGFTEISFLKHGASKMSIRSFIEAEKVLKNNQFLWEEIHFQSVLQMIIQSGLNMAQNLFHGKEKEEFKGHYVYSRKLVADWYKTAGSKFHPTSIPINWP